MKTSRSKGAVNDECDRSTEKLTGKYHLSLNEGVSKVNGEASPSAKVVTQSALFKMQRRLQPPPKPSTQGRHTG